MLILLYELMPPNLHACSAEDCGTVEAVVGAGAGALEDTILDQDLTPVLVPQGNYLNYAF